ncbi:MAG: serine/threonine protein kinase [Pirellulaceae bacterium]|nr:MAG: serine/threonine protein kinase [Pirellulaceae bacterium]
MSCPKCSRRPELSLLALALLSVFSSPTGATQIEKLLLTHELAAETEYYLVSPAQMRPPDGRWPRGFRLRVLQQAGSYWRVRAEDGTEAYVAHENIRQLEDPYQSIRQDTSKLVSGNTEFALRLYRELRKDEAASLFFSPASLTTAFAMAAGGARGKTQRELADGLGLPWTTDRTHLALAWFQQQVFPAPGQDQSDAARAAIPDDYQLRMANRLYGQKGFSIRDTFIALTRDYYKAEISLVDFLQPGVADQINQWVEHQTAGKIKNLVSDDMFNDRTRLVLVNAIYFYGRWSEPFVAGATRDSPFYRAGGGEVIVPLMHHSATFGYSQQDGVQILEMPYGKSKSVSMVVLLPEKRDGLEELEARLDAATLGKWLDQLRPRRVEVFFPKFRLETRVMLAEPLKALGIRQAFDAQTADFGGITDQERLFVSTAVHQAFLDVNEQGTEAAAATGIVFEVTAAPVDKTTFRADHPFVFLIRHRPTGAILFLGRYMGPES